MELMDIIYNILYIALGIVVTLAPCLISIIKLIKSKNSLTTELETATEEAETSSATVDMLSVMTQLVEAAEVLYDDVSEVLKDNGSSAAEVKKDSVMSKLLAYAIENGYAFDEDYWSEQIDSLIATTKIVNAATTEETADAVE